MNTHDDKPEILEKLKNILGPLLKHEMPEARKAEFLAWLKTEAERKRSSQETKASIPERIRYILDNLPVLNLGNFELRMPALARVAAVAFVAFIGFAYLFSPQYPLVSDMKGAVKICRANTNTWFFTQDRDKIRIGKGDIIKTFSDGRADIVLADRYHMRLEKDSEIKLAQAPSRLSGQGASYDLAKGKVYAYYNKLQGFKKEFDIRTNQADISVLGTDFMVSTSMVTNSTWVGVLDGVVKVAGINREDISQTGLQPVFVKPGEKTTVREGSSPSKPTRLMEDELMNLEELYHIGTKPQVALLISTGKTRTRELLSLTSLYISADGAGELPKQIKKIAKQLRQAIKESSKEKIMDNIEQFEGIVNKYPNPKYDVQFLLFIAGCYKHVGENIKAIDIFERVIRDYPKSSLTSIAQYAIGIIYDEILHDPDKAKIAYQKVVSNYPQSPEAEEAISGLQNVSGLKTP